MESKKKRGQSIRFQVSSETRHNFEMQKKAAGSGTHSEHFEKMVLSGSIHISEENQRLIEELKSIDKFAGTNMNDLFNKAIKTRIKTLMTNAERLKEKVANAKDGEIILSKGSAYMRIDNYVQSHIENKVQKRITQSLLVREVGSNMKAIKGYIKENSEIINQYNINLK